MAPPITVALPLATAAAVAACHRWIPRWPALLLSAGASLAVAALGVSLALDASHSGLLLYWFGEWTPRTGHAIGIDFAIDPTGAMLLVISATLVTFAIVFAFRYFDTAGQFFQVLMLIFLAALAGFSLTGDLFNLFVFFELMSAAAFALCGYKSEEPAPLQGALNFAVTNTIGAVLVLTGIALLYGRTGALNFAQIGRTLGGRSDVLVLAAFAFIVCGFLVKAAVVPFHFWLADAHAVAPTPVCVIFSGIMVEMGLYAVVRIYWTVFSGALGPFHNELRNLLMAFGAATALVGAVMCYAQRHLKRLLAFSTISHVGILLLGIGLLSPEALGGVGVKLLGHAMTKGGLFLAAGILLHRTGSVDEIDLHGRGRHLGWLAFLFFFGAAGLAGCPPFATFWGGVMLSQAAGRLGYHWITWVALGGEIVTAAAIFRFTSRVFLGWGPAHGALIAGAARIPEKPDTQGGHEHTPFAMYASATVLALLGAAAGMVPHLTRVAHSAALRMENRAAYAARVLDGVASAAPAARDTSATFPDLAQACGAVAAALLLAWLTVCSPRARRALGSFHPLRRAVQYLRDVHSGIIPDYVAWLVFGVAVFGGVACSWVLWHATIPAQLR